LRDAISMRVLAVASLPPGIPRTGSRGWWSVSIMGPNIFSGGAMIAGAIVFGLRAGAMAVHQGGMTARSALAGGRHALVERSAW